ncbi:alpha-ribazole phosphatase [biofilm metagenome]
MDIYLIRHTKTDTINGLCYGQSDVALADTFVHETKIIHEKLPTLSAYCHVYSSPLSRCVRLAESFQKRITIDDRLQEVNFGDWEGRRFNDLDQKALVDWTENFVTHAPPNGENFNELCRRVNNFWAELMVAAPAEQILLITHAGVIRALLANVLQLPPANAFKIRVDVGSVHKLRFQNDYIYIDYINR